MTKTETGTEHASSEKKVFHLPPRIQLLMWSLLIASVGIDLKVEGEVDPSVKTGVLAVAPHASHVDALAMMMALKKRAFETTAIYKEEYFSTHGLDFFGLSVLMPAWQAISTTTPAGIKQLIKYIKDRHQREQKELVLLFPQGTRANPQTEPLDIGVASIARMSGAPIVPVVIINNEKTFPKGMTVPQAMKIGLNRWRYGRQEEIVKFGPPINVATVLEENEKATLSKDKDRAIMKALQKSLVTLYQELDREVPPFLNGTPTSNDV